jgi:hypothetical protein
MGVVNKLMNRHQLHCSNAETGEIFDGFGVPETGVASAQLFRKFRKLF